METTSLAPALADWRRHAAVQVRAAFDHVTTSRAAERMYPHLDAATQLRAATTPASTTGWGSQVAGTAVAQWLGSLAPLSAAASLFARAIPIEFAGQAHITVPRLSGTFPLPVWVEEGAAVPVLRGALDSVALGPPRKLVGLSSITRELARSGGEAVITSLMSDAAAKALDASLFSTAAATSARPAGLLAGVTALSPTAASTGLQGEAMISDLRKLVQAISDAGAGRQILFIVPPGQRLVMLANGMPPADILPSPALAAGTIIAIDPIALVYAFAALPEIEIGREAVLHVEDGAPLAIATTGSPNTVAAPVLSAFQADVLAIRSFIRATWALRLAGAVQFMSGVSW